MVLLVVVIVLALAGTVRLRGSVKFKLHWKYRSCRIESQSIPRPLTI